MFVSIFGFGQETYKIQIEKRFNTALKNQSIKNACLQVYSASKGINIQLFHGESVTENALKMEIPFYTASITKMLTAVSIGILKDKNKLSFNDKIAQHLPKSILKNLHVLHGEEFSNKITIAQLLQHTSGLPDYFTDSTLDGSPNIINQILTNTKKSWSPTELIEFSKQKMKPHFVPGEGYHYNDTEYVILGLIIEKLSGLTLSAFFKQYLFKPFKMNSSFINLKSEPIDKALPLAKFYVANIDVSSFTSLSADWGGGGLVSTTQDLIRFFKALNEGLILKKATRLQMQNWVDETVGITYGFGIRKVFFKTLLNIETSLEVIGHTGSTGSFLWYCPQLDTYIVGSLNQLEASKSTTHLVFDILNLINDK
ncbi:beta-lactamase [Tamlana sedimentorum]|uniref:Beta-lactamase n=1 Tax=Neotamlana sedimentorum TaxID=1435349 RepID=A0A0D7W6E0_9FLAO|nr:beta-lactamase [Tamlana sedimentorum]